MKVLKIGYVILEYAKIFYEKIKILHEVHSHKKKIKKKFYYFFHVFFF